MCLLVLHAPDGSELTVQSEHISAVRPAAEFTHLAKGTNAMLYIAGEKFAIHETLTQVEALIGSCKERSEWP